MKIVQLSIFLENKAGRLAQVIEILAKTGVNIRALALADTKDFGVLRIIVDEPDKAVKVLKEANVVVKTTDIIAVEVEDTPGGLDKVLKVFKDEEINIEYMYAFVEKNNNNAVLVFRVDKTDESIVKLTAKKVKILTAGDVSKI